MSPNQPVWNACPLYTVISYCAQLYGNLQWARRGVQGEGTVLTLLGDGEVEGCQANVLDPMKAQSP